MTTPAGPATADAPLPAPPLRPGRAVLNAVIFALACLAGCAALGRIAPFPEVPGIYPKWVYFQKHRDSIDLLFVGSSRFYHQIIPAQFDAALAAAGRPLRSFNFGYDGMWPPESFYMVRRLLALRPARLKWVVIDLMDINTQLDPRNNSTLRMTYWHDLEHTALAFRDILASRFPPRRKLDFLRQHARLGSQQMLNLGRGAEALSRLLAPKPPRKRPYSWEPFAGFEAGPERGLEEPERAGFVDSVERLKVELAPVPLRPVFREALHALIAEVRAAGAEPIFVIAPTINGRENFTDLPAQATLIPLNRPLEYPELFDPATHYDSWHLNEQGAAAFTRILAREFLEHATPAAPR